MSNQGSASLSVADITISDDQFSTPSTTFTLDTGASRDLTVTFAPQVAGNTEGTLSVTSNDPNNGTQEIKLTGAGVAPTPDITSTSVDFGVVRVGETHKATLTIQNQGDLDLSIDSLSVDSALVTVSSTTFTLTPNSSRDLEVSLTPPLPDSITATLEIYSNDPDQPILPVSLIGVGGAPEITVSPALVDLERVSLDSAVSQAVTIMNTGLFDLSVDSLATGEEEAFSVSGATFVLNPDSSKMIDVALTPSEIDSLFDQLTIFSDAFNNAALTVQMAGVGVSPKIVTSPEKIDFGIVAIGDSSSSVLTIRNEGNGPLVIQSITISGQEAFGLSDSSLTLAPNDSSSIQIGFKSLEPGENTAEIRIQSNDRRRDIITVPIFASSLPVPDLFLSATDYSYGLVTSGASIPWVFAIHNLGTEILTITSVAAEPPFAVQGALPETVAVLDSVDIVILFSPSGGGGGGGLNSLTTRMNLRLIYHCRDLRSIWRFILTSTQPLATRNHCQAMPAPSHPSKLQPTSKGSPRSVHILISLNSI